jgi:hypothetical protein
MLEIGATAVHDCDCSTVTLDSSIVLHQCSMLLQ